MFRPEPMLDSIDGRSASYYRIHCATSRNQQNHSVRPVRPISRPINYPLEGRVTLSNEDAAYGKSGRDAEPLGQESGSLACGAGAEPSFGKARYSSITRVKRYQDLLRIGTWRPLSTRQHRIDRHSHQQRSDTHYISGLPHCDRGE